MPAKPKAKQKPHVQGAKGGASKSAKTKRGGPRQGAARGEASKDARAPKGAAREDASKRKRGAHAEGARPLSTRARAKRASTHDDLGLIDSNAKHRASRLTGDASAGHRAANAGRGASFLQGASSGRPRAQDSRPPSRSSKNKLDGNARKTSNAHKWDNRIVGNAVVDPETLLENPKNWRLHPKQQQEALRGVLDQVGWVQQVIVNKRTGLLVDGHLRVMLAKREGERAIPVVYVDLDPKEEALILAALDPIGSLADTNIEALNDILKDVKATNLAVDKLVNDLRVEVEEDDEQEEEEPTGIVPTGVVELKEDAIFSSSNEWDIPDLLPEMLYDGPLPKTSWPDEPEDGDPLLMVWNSTGLDEKMRGNILCYYTDDYRFEVLWNDAFETIKRVLPCQPAAAISPDFSLWSSDPLALQLWNIYRARWVSRYWQECGIKIIPSLATSINPECRKFAHAGWPKRPSVVAMQVRTGGMKSKRQIDATLEDIGHLVEDVRPKRLLLYGTKVRETLSHFLPKGVEYHWCKSFTDVRFDRPRKGGNE